jgi:hypothetical protein
MAFPTQLRNIQPEGGGAWVKDVVDSMTVRAYRNIRVVLFG